MTRTTKKVLYWILMFVILVALNTSSILWLVYQFIPSAVTPDISYWDVSVLAKTLDLQPNQYFSLTEKGLIYAFMGVGVIFSIIFVKWLFVDTLHQIRERAKEKRKEMTYEGFKKEYESK